MAESHLHRRLVRYLVKHARAHGVEIERAALPGFPQPYSIGGFCPDMIGWNGELPIVGEAETGASLCSAHTRDQLRAFAGARVEVTGQLAKVALAVPQSWRRRAREEAVAAGIAPSRLVLVSLPVRVRPRAQTPTFAQLNQRGRNQAVPAPGTLFERGRERPVAAPGTIFQRGRTRVSPLSQATDHQAELNGRARQIAREYFARRPLSSR